MHNTPHSEESKQKMSLKNKGKHYSISTEFKKGNTLLLGKRRPDISGEKHYAYKDGKKTGQSAYRSVHNWINRVLGKAKKCEKDENHKSRYYHWANISKKYKRDVSDWIQLCPSCNCKDRIGRRVAP